MNIVCVGLATVDLVQRVTRIPGVDEKVQALTADTATGGPAANAAVTAATLGATATLVTAVGAHPLAHLVREDLHRYGVTLLDATASSAHPPPISAITILDSTGQRTIVSRNAGDAGTWRPVFADLLPHATVAACSAAFRDPVGGLRRVRHGAVTHGPDPIEWWSDGRAGTLPVAPVAVVDTAGAGDVFHGALAVAVARDPAVTDLVAALAYAAGVAGIRVGHAGPRSWLDDPRLHDFRAPDRGA